MKVGDSVRWIDNGWFGIVLGFDIEMRGAVRCLLLNDSSICFFVIEELEVVCK